MLSQPDILLGKFAFQPLLYMILGYKMDVIQLICTSIDSVGDKEIGIATVIKIGTECSPTPVCRMNTQIHSDLAEFSISPVQLQDRKSTRLNSSHVAISYAVFCLKKKKTHR